ncbi:hypothetical protein POREN0001_0532 [Porphyromonas endodontalis ATCC 35406]|uniref:Uncharacterized protein n=1 Tax=Porphyromonas endodontalis (strain ATCC 35406 / DSM 24491 / JCM 8526 / CCUG 16442 / BCRC 14492 / NCTC 13058 / HG 370) TaxID=553175 RepID=C3J8L4_POREA|nr:hypothetical protein POREN0001_0532 [Porphyromonas endodontalis ATCC 35406]
MQNILLPCRFFPVETCTVSWLEANEKSRTLEERGIFPLEYDP